MKIILLEKVEKLGSLGDQVEVKNGYARNYLLPTGKALRATEENIKYFEEKASDLKKKNDKEPITVYGVAQQRSHNPGPMVFPT